MKSLLSNSSTEEEAISHLLAGMKGAGLGQPDPVEKIKAPEPLDNEVAVEEVERPSVDTKASEIEELKKMVSDMHKALTEENTRKALSELDRLKAERKQAILSGDIEAVDQLDRDIAARSSTTKSKDQALAEFSERNAKWLVQDYSPTALKIKEFADRRDKALGSYNLPVAEHLKALEASIKEEFPDYFGTVKMASSRVEKDSSPAKQVKKKQISISDLPKDEQSVARAMISSGMITEEAYIKGLNK